MSREIPIEIPVRQQVHWTSGRETGIPGIKITSEKSASFLPWEDFKKELENKMLRYLGQHLPEGKYYADTASGQDTKHWHIYIFNENKEIVGNVWVGAGPDNNMVWDGLIRAGKDGKTWQIFERWSDGSYRRVRVF